METYNVSHDNSDTLQMVSIAVRPSQSEVSGFSIRINALDFRNLEEKITRPIHIPAHINFHQNIMERFIDVFKDQVSNNPTYKIDEQSQIADKCFACIMAEPNIKIHKQCANIDLISGEPLSSENACTNCCCRPMWCVDCLARWFASRQTEFEREVWLEQKCTCPMCRAKFCLLDVSYLEKATVDSDHEEGSLPSNTNSNQ